MNKSSRSFDFRLQLWRMLIAAAIIAVWALIDWQHWLAPSVSKSPGKVFSVLIDMLKDGTIWTHTLATMIPVVVALIISAVIGIICGLVLAMLPRVEEIISPFLDAINSMPRIALAPVFIVLFGITQAAKIVLAFTLVVFILLVAARAGVHSVDPDVKRLAKTMGATKWQTFWIVLLPSAIPSIFAGLRLGLIYSLLAVVASELIAAKDGLGMLISKYSGLFQMEKVYALILVLMFIATILNLLMKLLEKKLLAWVPPETH